MIASESLDVTTDEVRAELDCNARDAAAVLDALTIISFRGKSVLSVDPLPTMRRAINWQGFVWEWTFQFGEMLITIGETVEGKRAMLDLASL